MTFAIAVILGFVQGLTEFLPVSSSAHLVFFQEILHVKDMPLTFDLVLHMATLIAVLAYYRRDIVQMLFQDQKYILFLIWGSVPTAIIGFFGHSFFESFFQGRSLIVAIFLIVTGIIIYLPEIFSKPAPAKPLTFTRAFIIGLFQGVAILPGISRSGTTITTACLLGIDRREAVRFSFLLSVPSIFGATVLQFIKEPIIIADIRVVIGGALVALLTGYGAIKVLSHLVTARMWRFFSYYCWIAGSAYIVWHVL